MKDAKIFESLKAGDNTALKYVYLSNKDAFIQFSKKYGISNYDALDIYQDSVLALRENIATGKLKELNSSVKTYLFGIGKYMIFDYLRANKKMISSTIEESNISNLIDGFEVLFKEEIYDKELQLKNAFEKLGEKCKAILTLFYYNNYNIEDITKALNYNNKDVVKSQKSRCLKGLKDKIENGR